MALLRRATPPVLWHVSTGGACVVVTSRAFFIRDCVRYVVLLKPYRWLFQSAASLTIADSKSAAIPKLNTVDSISASQGEWKLPDVKKPSIAKQQPTKTTTMATAMLTAKPVDDAEVLLKQVSDIIRKSGNEDSGDARQNLWDDPKFQRATGRLHELATMLTAPQLLHAVALLLPTCPPNSTDEDPFVVQSLENQLRWSMRRMTAAQLVRVLQLHTGAAKTTDIRRLVHDEALASLERRWVEIGSGRDLIALLRVVPSDAGRFLDRLDIRGLELCEGMTAEELYRMTYVLARRRRRSAPLLRALARHLGLRSLVILGPTHLANLAYALATLSVYEPALMGKIVSAAIVISERGSSESEPTEAAVVACLSSLIQSFGILRWHDTHLADTVATFFLHHRSAVSPADWRQLIQMAACINYIPAKLGGSAAPVDTMAEICSDMVSFVDADPCTWLDVVWCCAVLQKLTPNLAESVLHPDFIAKLEKVVDTNTAIPYTKLLNIYAVVMQNMISGYSGPQLSASFIDKAMVQIPARHHGKLFESVIEALSQIAPANQYINTDVCTASGHMIHIMMLANDRAELQPFLAKGTSLPADIHRIAIQVLNFADMTTGCVQPTGPASLAARTLQSAGYKVIQVPYAEYDLSATIAKRVQYLHRKLKAAILPVNVEELDSTSTSSENNNLRGTVESTETTVGSSNQSIESETADDERAKAASKKSTPLEG